MPKRPSLFDGALLIRSGAGNAKPFEILSAAGASILSVDEDGNLTIAGLAQTGAGLSQVFNIEDFGAVAGGDPTVNTTSINNAVLAAEATNGSVYIPARTTEFDIDGPITMNVTGNNSSLTIYGEGRGSKILGNFEGYVFERAAGTGGTPSIHIRDLFLKNSHAQGSAIQIHKVGQSSILRCTIEANRYGINTSGESTFGLHIGNNRIKSSGNPAGSIGIFAYGHIVINDENILANWDDAIRYCGVGVKIENNRLEVNNRAIVAGMDFAGSSLIAHASHVSGNTLEANGTSLYIYNAIASFFGAMFIQGTSNSPDAQSHYGVRIRAMRQSTLQATNVSGNHDQFAIGFDVTGSNVVDVALLSVSAANSHATAPAWVPLGDMAEVDLIQCGLS